MNPYATLVDFMLANISPEKVLSFRVSEEVHDYFYSLLDKEKNGTATPDEVETINNFMNVEHIMRLAKAKAKQYAHQ
ncbi:hypothetical protein [Spirosoma montaniterrae]|uniref:EF-hand domain-containing protein n=1 Tax=Spirosoma montaniterrae TaxID=1178516 RepID=A0A1P9WUC2_9BACT|nr:hypothetical protein [Spirosoma montaniterrae]AQG78940.1 hypothetical protein AWR27_06120 [Spirosoma montaniterrae]